MAPTPDNDIPLQDMKFEQALAELEGLVQTMEGGKLELEDSITAYRRGVALLQHCQGQLEAAEQKIQVLENGQLQPWNPEGGAA